MLVVCGVCLAGVGALLVLAPLPVGACRACAWPPLGGACCVGAGPPSRRGVLCWWPPAAVVVFGLGSRHLLGGLWLRFCCWLGRGWCCAGACPPPLLGSAVSACSGFGSSCCSGLDARLVFLVRCCLRRCTTGIVRCWLSVVFAWPGLVLCWCVPPPPGGACCVGLWPPSWCRVLCWCLPPLLLGRAVLVPACRGGSVWFGLSSPVRWVAVAVVLLAWPVLVLCWCVPPLPCCGLPCLCVANSWSGVLCRRVRVSVRGVVAGWMLGLFCWCAVVPAAVRPALSDCPWSAVFSWPGRTGRPPKRVWCATPLSWPGRTGRPPEGVRCAIPCFCFAGVVALLLVVPCSLESVRFLGLRWCLSPAAAVPPPPTPHPALPLVVFCPPPLASWCPAPASGCAPPPPPATSGGMPVSAANPHLLRFSQICPRLATFWSFSRLRRNRRPAAQSQDRTYIFLMCRI